MAGKGRRQTARTVPNAKEASPRLAAQRPASPSRRPADLSLPLIAGELSPAVLHAEVTSCRTRIPVPGSKDDAYTEAPRIPVPVNSAYSASSKEVVPGSWTSGTMVVGTVEIGDVRPFAEDLVGMAQLFQGVHQPS